MNSTEIIPSISITALLTLRDGVMHRIKIAHDAMLEANSMVMASPFDVRCPHVEVKATSYRYDRSYGLHEGESVEASRQIVDASMWDYLLKQSGLWSFMDAKARDEWQKQISDRSTPELSRDNIEATFSTIHANRFDMLERGVIECFKRLSWCYKTNKPFKFGKRLVIRFIQGTEATNKLDDLNRFFHIVDGKPEPDHRSSFYFTMFDMKPKETEYMTLKRFKNGNGHLTFKRPDLVDKMNNVLAKHYPAALPHDRNAA